VSLAVAPDGSTVYIGLDGTGVVDSTVRAVAVDSSSGQIVRSLAPQMPATSPQPPAGTPLPAVTPTPQPPFAPLPGSRFTLAANGALAISPDGLWLFDVATYTDATGQQTAVVRRYSTQSGDVAQTLALSGDFRLAALAASPSVMAPILYLATGGAAGQVYMLSTDATGPLLLGQVPLGGPAAPATSAFAGQISVSVTADGKQAYVSADVAVGSQPIAAHDIWLADSGTVSVTAHQVPFLGAGQVLPNWADASSGQSFDLIGGQVYLLSLAPGGGTTPWLRLTDGQPVVALIGTGAAQ
jgi:hypothetical protein